MSNRKFILKYSVTDEYDNQYRTQWYNTGIGMSSPDFARAKTMDTHELTETISYMSNQISDRFTDIHIREVHDV